MWFDGLCTAAYSVDLRRWRRAPANSLKVGGREEESSMSIVWCFGIGWLLVDLVGIIIMRSLEIGLLGRSEL